MTIRCVITGGASGLGLAMAKRWAKEGAHICIADRDESAAELALDSISAKGGKAWFKTCDVSSDADIQSLKEFTDTQLGQVDILITCAGVPTAGTIADETLEAWRWVLDINVLGSVRCVKAYVEDMRARGSGHIVTVASQAGITPAPLMGSYCASKAAIVAFSEATKLELAEFGIGVTSVCPGFVKTNLDQSLPAEQAKMQASVTKMVQGGRVTAESVADATFTAVRNGQFLVITHADGRKAWRLKRFVPALYFRMMTKQCKKFVRTGYGNE